MSATDQNSISLNYGFGGYGVGTFGNQPLVKLPIGYYLNLITSEYRQSPNFMAWLQAALQPIDDLTTCLAQIPAAFDLDYAVGAQLDICGQIVGTSRTVPFQPSNGVSPVLDDSTYRILLKAKIAQNHWDGRINSLYGIWQTLFPGGGSIVIEDTQSMAATVIISGSFSSIVIDLITNGMICPRPEGVLYNFVYSTTPVLGFDLNNTYVAGFDQGKFS